jgi:hypothetical protein
MLTVAAVAGDAPKLKPSESAVKKELTDVVEGQLAAFRTNDFKTAYTFAATAIKEQFPLAAFEQMVKSGYPVIAQSATATFGVILDDGTQAVVNTVVKGRSGKIVRYQYMLVREGRGWKITGVMEQAGSGESA